MSERHRRSGRHKQRRHSTKRPSYPHDSVFKKIFKRPEYCRALMQVVLPPSFYAFFDWARLKIRESVATGAKGEERRADIVIEVPLSHTKFRVIITIILEHKSYRDNRAVLQMLGYYNEIAQESSRIILPVIVTCGQDKTASIPSDYLSWALQQQGAPAELQKHFRRLPNFHCLVVNLHDLSYRRMRRGGEAVSLALFGMRNYWDMDEEVVVEILKRARLLARQEREFVLSVLMDYYACADKGFGRKGFDEVERKRFPHLKEEERLMPEIEFGFDRARQQGRQLGIKQGVEQGRLETVKHFLLEGVDEQIICKAAKLSKQELEEIKRSLDQN